ncbi:MAG: hypothetical protein WC848_03795 [Parcubacteria group bacterium]|jgi:hypothetical protein
MDLILHTYDNLYKEFVDNGYVPDRDLFELPYEWRDSNIENAKLLAQKIQDITTQNNWPKVDIVAHSMGGLLAREYVESDYYADDIDQLVTLGTPQNGAPGAYLKWDGDGWFWDLSDMYTKHILTQEAQEARNPEYADLFDYIHQRPIASLQELLPVYNYLQDVENDDVYKIYPLDYPENIFLENLNSAEKKGKLNYIEFDKIVGKAGSDEGTIVGFKVIDAPEMGKYWDHGYPLGFEIPLIGDRGLTKGIGDGTVPLESAKSENIPSDEYVEINAAHVDLPTKAQKDILELLTGVRPTGENDDSLIKNLLIVSVYSPIDVQIIAPDGLHWAGKKIRPLEDINQIKGAYYTGYNGIENEFITIPDPVSTGEYQIITEGTGNGGDYRVEVAKISERSDGVAEESTAKIFGTAVAGETEEKTVEIKEGKLIDENSDREAPTVEIQNPKENKKYPNDRVLKIEYSLSDNQSQADKITAEIFWDNAILAKNEIDLRLQKPGTHGLKIVAKDDAGNVGTAERSVEVVTDAGAILKNIDYYFAQKLIKTQTEKKFLSAHLLSLKISQELLLGIENCAYALNSKLRLALISGLERQISLEIALLEKHLETATAKIVTPEGKELLLANLAYLKK